MHYLWVNISQQEFIRAKLVDYGEDIAGFAGHNWKTVDCRELNLNAEQCFIAPDIEKSSIPPPISPYSNSDSMYQLIIRILHISLEIIYIL